MFAVGVTGGLGSGKSTVVRLLGARGATTIDADALARAALEPGTSGAAAVVERFGPGVLADDGAIDRGRLAAIVFADAQARRDLEAIVHPVVRAGMLTRIEVHAGSDAVVVLDLPLLVESGGAAAYRLDGVLVVDTPLDLAIARVTRDRGLSKEDARARIAAQIDPAERLRAANFIIMNHGSLADLDVMVDGAWRWIAELRDGGRPTAE